MVQADSISRETWQDKNASTDGVKSVLQVSVNQLEIIVGQWGLFRE